MDNQITKQEYASDELDQAYKKVREIVEKNYLSEISYENKGLQIVSLPDTQFDVSNAIRFYQITKIVFDKDEETLDKLTTVYNTVHSLEGNLILMIHSRSDVVELYIGVKNSEKVTEAASGFIQSFNGNFPGCIVSKMFNSDTKDLLAQKIFTSSAKAVSVANGIPNLKDDDKEKFTQGLEKFIEAMQGKEYTALLIANAVDNNTLAQRRSAYEKIYSSMVPFSEQNLTFGMNESRAATEGISQSFAHTVSEYLSNTTSNTTGTNKSDSESNTHTGGVMGGIITPIGGAGLNYSYSRGKTSTKGTSKSQTTGKTEQKGTSDAQTDSTNSSKTLTEGSSQSFQLKGENKTVKNLLEKIDTQIKRIQESEDYGMYDFAAYFISDDYSVSKVAASTYRAVMRGEESSAERSSVSSWSIETSKKKIIPYLKRFEHPVVSIGGKMTVTPTTLVSSKELALAMNLPRKSVKGVAVVESAEFARDIHFLEETTFKRFISIGSMYHLGKAEENSVALDVDSLSMHTFITGSTGSGKSNTIYKILNELLRKDIKFLVVEPTKGEYKNVFGGRKDVEVFGSNPRYTKLLKINPFEFDDEIHVLEHIDRLIEIFNTCWPMYAAMPAVLKDATIRSYVACGWDVDSSVCIGERVYPTFDVMLSMLEEVIESSQYADEMKSNYKGALITRVKSLTIGLLGQMMNQPQSIDEEILFDGNIIVDISRVGSMETKSLIMGILMLKLLEYRSAKRRVSNAKLKHVTVLEEAHHLLKRTSTEQSGESANLQGKAVEMLSNAIAEMRTYGEGFIIADQSPNMLDMSAIRNTGTKIIMRLPELTDRNDIGKAAALNEKQIDEIPKLATGVGVVYQNNWLEAVLCKISQFEEKNFKPYNHNIDLDKQLKENKKALSNILKILLAERVDTIDKKELDAIDTDMINHWIAEQKLSSKTKKSLSSAIEQFKLTGTSPLHREKNFAELSKMIYELTNGAKILSLAKNAENLEEYDESLMEIIRHFVDTQNREMFEIALAQAIMSHESRETSDFKKLYFSWVENKREEKGDVS